MIRQEEIRGRCFHPSGSFVQLSEEEINASIPERFEKQVVRRPNHSAYTNETHTLTYHELNCGANQIAHAVVGEEVGNNQPVISLMDEGVDRISTFFGILKSGMCHVAISPDLPIERQQFMVDQSDAAIMVVSKAYRELAGQLAGKNQKVIELGKDTDELSTDNLHRTVQPNDRCWIVYTSGSTGEPKGATQTHRNMLHDCRTYVENFHVSVDDRLSLLMSLSTLAGCFCTLMALCNGATLCQIDVKRLGVTHMASEVARQRITIWGGVPSLFRQWLVSDLPDYPHLRVVWFGGEAVHARDFELYKENLSPDCVFVNRLGSTETGCIRIYFADHQTEISGFTVPVGYPVRGQEVYLEDSEGGRVKSSGSGEIVLRSRYLSPEYWKRPDLTENAYTPDEDDPELRTYHMGDLARMDVDGCLTYLGRKDFQVQIRGYRVEVAEIESILDQLESVREVVVHGMSLPEGGQTLVAYLVSKETPGSDPGELRKILAEKLPDYMIPSAFVYLDELPRSANGKIVRNQLPQPAQEHVLDPSNWIAPRSTVEKKLADIWEEVLDIEVTETSRGVGVEDNFFAIGGQSLRATQVINRIKESLAVDVPLRSFFDLPTIAELAQEVERLIAESD